MKDKTTAAILSFFFGTFGIQRFYLNQPVLGILCIVFSATLIPTIIGLADAIIFFSMDQEDFDDKYNERYFNRRRERSHDRQQQRRHQSRSSQRSSRSSQRPSRSERSSSSERQRRPSRGRKENPYRERAGKKYKDYDYRGAIEDFKKSLEVESHDKNVHFMLACSYSLTEQPKKSLFHLDKAMEQGFDDHTKLHEHDALAYLRIQPEFDIFVDNGYKILKKIEAPKQEESRALDDLILNKIERLGELKEKGFISEDEFQKQKKKLLG